MNNKVDIIGTSFFFITIITGMYNLLEGNDSKVFKAILLLAVLAISKILFKKTFLKKSSIGYIGVMLFCFLSIYLANLFGFYGISYYDKFLHLISGIMIYYLGIIIYVSLNKNSNYKKDVFFYLFPLFFSIALAGVWEIWEFTTDLTFGLNAQNNSLIDTMTDIICGTVGAIISLLLSLRWRINGKGTIINKIIKELEE